MHRPMQQNQADVYLSKGGSTVAIAGQAAQLPNKVRIFFGCMNIHTHIFKWAICTLYISIFPPWTVGNIVSERVSNRDGRTRAGDCGDLHKTRDCAI